MGYENLAKFQEESRNVFLKLPESKSKIYQTILFPENPVNEALIRTDTMHAVDIMKALEKYPELLDHFSHETDNKFLAYNNASFNAGLVLPIEEDGIVHLSIESNAKHPAVVRNLFIVGEKKRCDVVLRVLGSGPLHVTNIVVAKHNSHCRFGMINESSSPQSLFTQGKTAGNAQIDFFNIQTSSNSAYAVTENHLNGMHSQGRITDVYICENLFEGASKIYCHGKNNKGTILSKGIARKEGKVTFEGYAKIDKQAENADVFVGNHAIILEKGAKANLIPNLEIENNNVKAGHTSSVHQFDEEKLFYMMARGLDEERARKLLIEGFLFSAIDTITIPEIREFIEKRA